MFQTSEYLLKLASPTLSIVFWLNEFLWLFKSKIFLFYSSRSKMEQLYQTIQKMLLIDNEIAKNVYSFSYLNI